MANNGRKASTAVGQSYDDHQIAVMIKITNHLLLLFWVSLLDVNAAAITVTLSSIMYLWCASVQKGLLYYNRVVSHCVFNFGSLFWILLCCQLQLGAPRIQLLLQGFSGIDSLNIHCLILNFILGAFSSKTRHGPCLCYEDPEKSRHAGKGAGEITENIHLFIKHLFVWCIYSRILCFCWLGT